MTLRERLSQALKDAMKAREADRTSTLRLIGAAIRDRDIAARGEGRGEDGIDESEIMALLGKMIKQRQDSAKIYEEGGRLELAEKELAEVKVIEGFLPKQLGADEVVQAIDAVIVELGATSIRDMGRIMAALKERYTGQMDFGAAGGVVKSRFM